MTPLPQLIHYMHLYYFPRGSQHHVFVAMSNVPHYLRNTSKADKLVNLRNTSKADKLVNL